MTEEPEERWSNRVFWFVVIWALSIAALAIATLALRGFFSFING